MARKAFALVFLVSLVAALSSLETAVGSVISLRGEVRIDAFGKGAFINAIKGDLLYGNSVLSSGPGGSASLSIGGTTIELPPASSTRVADLLAATAKKRSSSWLKGIGDLIDAVRGAGGAQAEVSLGTRAAEAGEDSFEWVLEGEDDAELIESARGMVEARDYAGALVELAAARIDEDSSLYADLAWIRGHASFALENYGEAATWLGAALSASGSPLSGFAFAPRREELLFELGAARFLVGDERGAVAPLDSLLAGGVSAGLEPYARLLLIKSLNLSGSSARADGLLQAARKRYAGTPSEGLFAKSLAEL